MDCIITSPPYYGMRIYSGTEAIWGGDPHCKHEWREYVTIRNNNLPAKPISKICSKCGAWFGQLGFEPSAETYLDHLLQIITELKRVLKPTGLMFWAHNNTYSGSWCGQKKCMLMLPLQAGYPHNRRAGLGSEKHRYLAQTQQGSVICER